MKKRKSFRRAVSLLLALNMLFTPLAKAAETAELTLSLAYQYAAVFYNIGYRPYADTDLNSQPHYLVEGWLTNAGYQQAGEARNEGFSTLEDLAKESAQKVFPLKPMGRVPDRTFEGYYVYEGPVDEETYSPKDFRDNVAYQKAVRGADELTEAMGSSTNKALQEAEILPLIGRWALSSDATLVPDVTLAVDSTQEETAFYSVTSDGREDTPLTLYTSDIEGLTPAELSAVKTTFSAEENIYYLRVPADVEALDVSLVAAEPFTDSAIDAGGVTISANFGGEDTVVPALEYRPLNSGEEREMDSGKVWAADNSDKNPARSLWCVMGGDAAGANSIKLMPSAGAETLYNVITVTVTAPNGTDSKEYVFNVQRLADPQLVQAPGNSPMGMIMRNDFSARAASLNTTSEKMRQDAIAYFKANKHFSNSRFVCWPDNVASGNRETLHIAPYHQAAWGTGENYDLDPGAIVAYQNSRFVEPGIAVTDSEGKPLTLGEAETRLERKILLRQVEALTARVLTDEGGDACAYTSDGLTTDVDRSSEAVTEREGKLVIDLQNKNIKPGIYEIEYRLGDPVVGDVFSAGESDAFYQKALAEDFTRTLIVLPIPGDVNMDGVVTAADGVVLRSALADSNAPLNGESGTARLFRYRVCDVNWDGVVNEADVTALLSGFKPQIKRGTIVSDYFYIPLPGGVERVREPAPDVPMAPDDRKAGLSLEFLGEADGEMTPDMSATTAQMEQRRMVAKTQKLQLDDIFWVGVRMEDMDRLANTVFDDGLYGMTLTLGYDANLVEPVSTLMVGGADIQDLTGWRALVEEYNIGDETVAATLPLHWGGAYALTGAAEPAFKDSESERDFSKGISQLERQDNYRELTISVDNPTENAQRRNLYSTAQEEENGGVLYLLRVPFKVIRHPHGQERLSALDLSLGMRQLTMSSHSKGSAAWSMGDIYGGSTENLADIVECRGGSALVIALGNDLTEYTPLTNQIDGAKGKTVYGEPFKSNQASGALGDGEKLPLGLSYQESTQTISGTPQAAGVYTFYIGNKPYELTVERAPLTLTVNPQVRYYGEENPNFTFVYDVAQIKALDRPGGVNYKAGFSNSGAWTELKKIQGWTKEPVRSPVDKADEGTPIPFTGGPESPAGSHFIKLEGGLNDNYKLVYTRPNQAGITFDDWGYGGFRILPRPIRVERLRQDVPVGTVLSDGATSKLTELEAIYSPEQKDFSVVLAADGAVPGVTLTPELTVRDGDSLALLYTATYQFKSGVDKPPLFVLGTGMETRDVVISDLRLTANKATENSNYVLINPYIRDSHAVGQVVVQPVKSLEIVSGIPMEYNHGSILSLDSLAVRLTYANNSTKIVKYGTAEGFAAEGLRISWSEAATGTPLVDPDHLLVGNQELATGVHNGKHLCVSVENPQTNRSVGEVVAVYSQQPFHIRKVGVVVTLEPKARYYGEENPEFTFTYDLLALAPSDRVGRTGKGSDLLGVPDGGIAPLDGYTPPNIWAGTLGSAEIPVTVESGAGTYRVYIAGATSTNYDFYYRNYSGEDTSTTLGWQELLIHRRPIAVDKVIMSATGAHAESTYFLYDDTKKPILVEMYYTDGAGNKKPTATSGTGKDSFTALLPETAGYYMAQGSEQVKLQWPLDNAPAIVNGDVLKVTYQANFKPDNAGGAQFTLAPGKAYERRMVNIRNLTLDTAGAGNNYELVYRSNSSAVARSPLGDATAEAPVRLRPIEGVEIIKAPAYRAYTYGDVFSLNGMELKLTYETNGDNTLGFNDTVPSLVYGKAGADSDTFRELGLHVYWRDGQTMLAEAEAGDYVTVKEHNQKGLRVSGRRNETHTTVFADTEEVDKITVAKKELLLIVTGQNRYYGEPNGTYEFRTRVTDLILPDQDKVAGLITDGIINGTATAIDTSAVSTALGRLGGYIGPVFATVAADRSEVDTYGLKLSGGAMDNYSFAYQNANIRVFRRPIVVSKITKDPVTTIFRDAPEVNFTTYARSGAGFASNLPVAEGAICKNAADPVYNAAVKDSMRQTLTMTGAAVCSWDSLELRVDVRFKPVAGRPTVGSGGASNAKDGVTVNHVVLSDTRGQKNYILVVAGAGGSTAPSAVPTDKTAIGEVDLRDIEKIEVVDNPRTDYKYSQKLDLSGLRVKIYYKAVPGQTTPEPETVAIGERGGIYVNYWPSPTAPTSEDAIKTVVAQNRPAISGDHLTRAPAHDAGKYPVEDARFAHHGKYLIVSAIRHGDYGYTQPVVVQMPIQVATLDLTYGLAAVGKVYDGDDHTVGSITLNNAYNADGITDVVYAVTGADYETGDEKLYSSTLHKPFLDYVAQRGGYTFSSGTVENGVPQYTHPDGYGKGLTLTFLDRNVKYADQRHSAETMVAANDDYWDQPDREPRHDAYGPVAPMPVTVSGITLGGPDRGNYTLDLSVDRTTNVDDVTKDTVPFATIEKAQRSAPTEKPTVSVDRHTNAAKLTFTQALDELHDTDDDFNDELHFEYALAYSAPGVTPQDPMVETYWAGDDGLAPRLYQDTMFFGGEAVQAYWPDGYKPEREEEPQELKEDDVIRGQIYRWAEDDSGFRPVVGSGTWEGYVMYTTERAALPRSAAFWARVRLSETHNYNASPHIQSSDNVTGDIAAAQARITEENERLTSKDYRPDKDEDIDPEWMPAPVAITYTQRMDVISTEDSRGADGEQYNVPTLESVWFTNVQEYEKKEILDNVLRNADPTRYYGYAWDIDESAQLDFKDPLVLTGPFAVNIKRKVEGGTEEDIITVNEDGTAVLYANIISPSSGVNARSIRILQGNLSVLLGAAAVQLKVEYTPKYTSPKRVKWSSADESVAKVDNGLVSFVGSGRTIITATTTNGKTDSVTVTVYPANTALPLIDLYYDKAFFQLDEELRFYPESPMTRGELAILFAALCHDVPGWGLSGSGDFGDIAGNEDYAGAARYLGERGIITGVPGGYFEAARETTRAEFAVIVARLLGVSEMDTTGRPHAFKDAGEGETWAYSAIDTLAEMNLMQGTGGGYFSPGTPITRAEVAVILERIMLKKITDRAKVLNRPIDVHEESWAYGGVIRAVNNIYK